MNSSYRYVHYKKKFVGVLLDRKHVMDIMLKCYIPFSSSSVITMLYYYNNYVVLYCHYLHKSALKYTLYERSIMNNLSAYL